MTVAYPTHSQPSATQSSTIQPSANTQQLLAQELRDIHLPDAVSWWPPAPGWWLLLALLASLVIVLYKKLKPLWLQKKDQRYLIQQVGDLKKKLKHWGPSTTLANQCAILLKRICLRHFPTEQVSPLTGKAWVEFLNAQVPGPPVFSPQSERLLCAERFQARAPNAQALNQLLNETQRWIEQCPRRRA